MRILVLSDLHLEFSSFPLDPPAVDVVVLAGDTHLGVRGVRWAAETFDGTPVIYVPGNHEYYRSAYPRLLSRMVEAARGSSVMVLDNDWTQIKGVSFFGATLWTDFLLTGDQELAMLECQNEVTDYRLIRINPSYRWITPRRTLTLHNSSVRWLGASLDRCSGPRVVVTHHAPSPRSFGEAGVPETPLSAGYASDLEPLVEASGAALWVHGHLHLSADYRVGRTRVICNPRGYPDESRVNGFDEQLIVEV